METYVFLCAQFRTDLRTPAELRALKITQASSREKLAWEVEERASRLACKSEGIV